MNARQFTAPTAREALALARKALGPDAVILGNRKTGRGICVTAMQESALLGLQVGIDEPGPMSAPDRTPMIASRPAAARPAAPQPPAALAAADAVTESESDRVAPTPAMSTLSFQQFANDRRSRRAQAEPASPPRQPARNEAVNEVVNEQGASRTEPAMTNYPGGRATAAARPDDDMAGELMAMAAELRQMRSFISQQFSALSWVDGVRRTPGQAQVLRRLLAAGFSAQLARTLVGHLPAGLAGPEADRWLTEVLARNLAAPAWNDNVLGQGGVFALVGPTGVGKTTTVAKIAARCALAHGVEQVGLVTADAYRVGAQDQLRRFGAMIGITVHTAHDSASLQGILSLLEHKRVVLIDTAGLGQRDERITTLLDAVSQGPVQRLLVLSAAAQVDAMREAVDAYRGNECAGVLLTKVDECCRLGGALDTLIRGRLRLLAVANGQRVPEDLQDADPQALVERAFQEGHREAYQLPDIDLTMMMQRVDAPAEGTAEADQPGLASAAPAEVVRSW